MKHLQGQIEGVAVKRGPRSAARHGPQRGGGRGGDTPPELIRHVWSHIELSRKNDRRIYLDETTVGVLEPLSSKAVSIRLIALAACRHTLSWIASVAGRVLNESCFETSCSKYGTGHYSRAILGSACRLLLHVYLQLYTFHRHIRRLSTTLLR